MSSENSQSRKRLEAIYGRLGDAQIVEFEKLIQQDPQFRLLDEKNIWLAINRPLLIPGYSHKVKEDVKKELTMSDIFPSPDQEYPDIFSEQVEDVHMDDYL